jgi:hypothetical protein
MSQDIIPYRLADEPDTYGDRAGKYILTTSDGEHELGTAIYDHATHAMEAAAAIERIARKHFCVETLLTRHRDRLDFREVLIGEIRNALAEAYEAA